MNGTAYVIYNQQEWRIDIPQGTVHVDTDTDTGGLRIRDPCGYSRESCVCVCVCMCVWSTTHHIRHVMMMMHVSLCVSKKRNGR